MKKLLIPLAIVALATAVSFLAVNVGIVKADNGSPNDGKIYICHHSGNSQNHEWVYIHPDASGVWDGHAKGGHQDFYDPEDLIPPFSFVDAQGVTHSFDGQNLGTTYNASLEPTPGGEFTGQQLLDNHCVPPTTSTTTGTTTTGTTETTTTGTTTTGTTGTTTTGTTTTGTTGTTTTGTTETTTTGTTTTGTTGTTTTGTTETTTTGTTTTGTTETTTTTGTTVTGPTVTIPGGTVTGPTTTVPGPVVTGPTTTVPGKVKHKLPKHPHPAYTK